MSSYNIVTSTFQNNQTVSSRKLLKVVESAFLPRIGDRLRSDKCKPSESIPVVDVVFDTEDGSVDVVVSYHYANLFS